jgi:hypothetical protein
VINTDVISWNALANWTQWYSDIADEFSDVIAAHFAGRPAAAVPPVAQPPRSATGDNRPGLAAALWHGGLGGFAAAAAAAERPLTAPVEAVLERAEEEITRLRKDAMLYDAVPGRPAAVAPLDDPPPPVMGTFSSTAEAALLADAAMAVPGSSMACAAR